MQSSHCIALGATLIVSLYCLSLSSETALPEPGATLLSAARPRMQVAGDLPKRARPLGNYQKRLLAAAEGIARRAKQSTRRQSTQLGLLETHRLSSTRTRPGMLEKLANTERQLRSKAVRRFQSGNRQHGKVLMQAVQQYKRRQRALRKSTLQTLKAQDEKLQATVLADMNKQKAKKAKKGKKEKKGGKKEKKEKKKEKKEKKKNENFQPQLLTTQQVKGSKKQDIRTKRNKKTAADRKADKTIAMVMASMGDTKKQTFQHLLSQAQNPGPKVPVKKSPVASVLSEAKAPRVGTNAVGVEMLRKAFKASMASLPASTRRQARQREKIARRGDDEILSNLIGNRKYETYMQEIGNKDKSVTKAKFLDLTKQRLKKQLQSKAYVHLKDNSFHNLIGLAEASHSREKKYPGKVLLEDNIEEQVDVRLHSAPYVNMKKDTLHKLLPREAALSNKRHQAVKAASQANRERKRVEARPVQKHTMRTAVKKMGRRIEKMQTTAKYTEMKAALANELLATAQADSPSSLKALRDIQQGDQEIASQMNRGKTMYRKTLKEALELHHKHMAAMERERQQYLLQTGGKGRKRNWWSTTKKPTDQPPKNQKRRQPSKPQEFDIAL